MGEINWDEMLRDLEQREAELDEFCSGMGFDLSDETREVQEEYLNNINYDMSYHRVRKELIETFN